MEKSLADCRDEHAAYQYSLYEAKQPNLTAESTQLLWLWVLWEILSWLVLLYILFDQNLLKRKEIKVFEENMVAESAQRCNFRKHMQIEKAPANQENIFINLTAGAANAHNTNK